MNTKSGEGRQLQVERRMGILNLLKQRSVVKVDDLSDRLLVSANTIRRDLAALEQEGLLRRTQGGAVPNSGPGLLTPFRVRQKRYLPEKESIARAAVRYIAPGESVILDAGTTMVELAREIARLDECTVLTNSLEVGSTLQEAPQISLMMSGGALRHSSRCLVGSVTESFFASYNVNCVFLSVRGVSVEKGCTNLDVQETAVKKCMVTAGKKVIVLADSSKIGNVALSTVCPIDSVYAVITDWNADPTACEAITAAGVSVVVVPKPSV